MYGYITEVINYIIIACDYCVINFIIFWSFINSIAWIDEPIVLKNFLLLDLIQNSNFLNVMWFETMEETTKLIFCLNLAFVPVYQYYDDWWGYNKKQSYSATHPTHTYAH